MKNYIFLDMDGVLNNQTFEKEFKESLRKELPYLTFNQIYTQFTRRFVDVSEYSFYNGFIVPENLNNWNRLITSVNAEVVFSSDWRRIHFETGDMLAYPNQIQELFNKRDMKGKVVGVTPIDDTWHRGREIYRYIIENHIEDDRILVIDDLDEVNDINFKKVVKNFMFINTDYKKGLTTEEVDKAIEFLKGE